MQAFSCKSNAFVYTVHTCVRPRDSYFWNILYTEIDCRLLLTVRRVVRRVIYHFACLVSSDLSVCRACGERRRGSQRRAAANE